MSSFPENPKLNPTFPAKDALDIAEAIRVGGAHRLGVDHVDIRVFASGTADEPQKWSIAHAFEDVAKNAVSRGMKRLGDADAERLHILLRT